MDYWQLNAMMIKDYYSLPLIKETLAYITKIKIFTKIDI